MLRGCVDGVQQRCAVWRVRDSRFHVHCSTQHRRHCSRLSSTQLTIFSPFQRCLKLFSLLLRHRELDKRRNALRPIHKVHVQLGNNVNRRQAVVICTYFATSVCVFRSSIDMLYVVYCRCSAPTQAPATPSGQTCNITPELCRMACSQSSVKSCNCQSGTTYVWRGSTHAFFF